MSDDRFARLKEIVLAAAHLPEAERTDYLDRACAGDDELRRKAGAYLSRLDEGAGLLETGGAAKALQDDIPTTTGDPIPTGGHLPGKGGPQQIGPYRILHELGSGGMGIVYRAEQRKPIRREVALKLVKLGMDTREVIARFESERQALAMMDHPSIAKVFDAGATELGRPYFVMEYVRGIPITRFADQNSLGIRGRLELFAEVCGAVHHAHQKGIIHRDLKPSNILVTTANDIAIPKVIDFGIAKATGEALTEKTLVTEQGQFIGTPEYMSPEQADSGGIDIDTRTDVYALGILLYELLSGTLPFTSETLRSKSIAEIHRIIREEDPPRPSTKLEAAAGGESKAAAHRATTLSALRRQLAGDLDWITLHALEKNRARRYESAAAFGDDIRRFLRNEAVVARPQTGVYRFKKLVARHKLSFSFAAGVLVLLIAFAVSMGVLYSRALIAERRAAEESTAAKEVARFLTDLFEVSDPGEARGNRVTAREILDQGAARIRSELAGRPGVRATMMSTMGNVYRKLGLYEEARPLLEEALATRQSLSDNAPLQLSENLILLGALHSTGGRYDEAMPMLEEALAIRKEHLAPDDVLIAEPYHLIAMIHWNRGNSEEAESLLGKAVAIAEKGSGEGSSEYAEYLDALAVIMATSGRIDEAAPYFHRALEVRLETIGTDHPSTALSWSNLGMLHRAQGNPVDAIEAFEQSLAIREKILGPDHIDVAASVNNMGLVDNDEGRYEIAEERHRRALRIREAALGPDHPYIGESSINIAYAIERLGRWEESIELYKRALSIYRNVYGDSHALIAYVCNDIATVLSRHGKKEEAYPWRKLTAKEWAAAKGPSSVEASNSLFDLGRAQIEYGDLAEGEVSLRRTLEIREELLGDDDEATVDVRNVLASLTGS